MICPLCIVVGMVGVSVMGVGVIMGIGFGSGVCAQPS